MDVLCAILFGVMIVTGITGVVMQHRYYARLRKLHPVVWAQLHPKPFNFLHSDPSNTGRFLRFMWRKDYESLPDPQTISSGHVLRKLLLFYTLVFLVTMVAFGVTISRSLRRPAVMAEQAQP